MHDKACHHYITYSTPPSWSAQCCKLAAPENINKTAMLPFAVQEKGHEDLTALVTEQFTKQGLTGDKAKAAAEEEIWGFAGPIESVKRLAYVLSTIAWLASAHHAAVNFGTCHTLVLPAA